MTLPLSSFFWQVWGSGEDSGVCKDRVECSSVGKLMLGAWWEFCWLRLHPFHEIVEVDLDRFILHLYFWFVHIIRMLVSHLVLWYVRNKGINKTILLRQHGWDIFLLNWWAWFPLHLLLFFYLLTNTTEHFLNTSWIQGWLCVKDQRIRSI